MQPAGVVNPQLSSVHAIITHPGRKPGEQVAKESGHPRLPFVFFVAHKAGKSAGRFKGLIERIR